MNLRDAAKVAAGRLTLAGIPDAELEAEFLVRLASATSRAQYFAGGRLADDAAQRLECFVERRTRREPSAYIAGRKEFFALEFEVNRSVLIPRPETELLVEIALNELKQKPAATVVDVGTGGGCIAVSVAANARSAKVVATETSAAALAVAKRNARRHDAPVRFVRCELAAAVRQADIVVANLPYIPSAAIATLAPEIRDWEPRNALDGGPDGLDFIRALIADCAGRLHPALLALEVQYDQGATVAALARQHGAQADVMKDYAGIDRVVCARWQ